jgi:1-acyl-sn-glycerol-3-phosphate acyltransferase
MGVRRGAPWTLRTRLAAHAARNAFRGAVRALRRFAYLAYLGVATLVAGIVVFPVVWALAHLLPAGQPVRALARWTSRFALRLAGCRVHVEQSAGVSSLGPCVLVVNHASYADTPTLLAALPVDFVFVAMREVLDWPLVGTFTRRGGHPTVDRWHVEQSLADAEAIEERLRLGQSPLFFAEGGFSGMRGLRPFRMGAFTAAALMHVPVVPIALRGTRHVLPADTHLPHPARIDVWIGAPMHATGSGWNAALDLRNRAAAAIAEHCGEPRMMTD